MAWPVVIATNGKGLPVTEASNGLGVPYEIASNGFGTPVVFVDAGGVSVSRAGYLPEAISLFERMDVQPSPTAKRNYDDLIGLYITTGLWDTRDAIYAPVFAETEQQASLNIRGNDAYDLTKISAPTFTAGAGFSFAGGYYSTGFNPATAGGFLTQNDVSIRAFVTAIGTNTATASVCGNTNLRIIPANASGNFQHRANQATTQGATPNVGPGIYSASRNNSATYRQYINGSGNNLTQVSAAPTSAAILVGTNTGATLSPDTLGLLDFGAAVTDQQELDFWTGF